MKKVKLSQTLTILLWFVLGLNLNAQNVASFDDLPLPADSFWNGSNMAGGFTDANFYFPNNYTSYGGSAYGWGGFAYSNKVDTITPGLPNQFAAITGTGYNNSTTYAVSSVLADFVSHQPIPNVIKFSSAKAISGFYVSNSTYAYLSMLNGDQFAKKFGGTSGNDPDWFMLKIKGYHSGIVTDTVKFYLADFRFANNSQDYIVKDWRWCNLLSLGTIDSIEFTLWSSDIGLYGMNTPSYFCMDNFNGTAPTNGISESKPLNFDMNVYPNPFVDNINIMINEKIAGKLSITDVCGREIKSIANFKGGKIDLNETKAGIYFITYTTSVGIITKKVSKK